MIGLGAAGIAAIDAMIAAMDPEGKYVRFEPTQHLVSYSQDFEFGEQIGIYEGEEEPCRALIVCWLCTIGGYLPSNIALERRYSIGRPKIGAELDILVRKPDGTAFALIEVKAPVEYDIDQDKFIKGQLFDIAPLEPGASILSFASVKLGSNGPEIVAKTIDYLTYPTFAAWSNARAHAITIPVNYGEPVHVHYAKGGTRDLRTDVPLTDLRRMQRRLHDVLWRGSTPDNKIYDQVIKLFLAKAHDEKTTGQGADYNFQVRYPGNTRETPEETFSRVSSLFKVAFRKYMGLAADQEVDGLDNVEFSAEQTAFVVELLQDISLVHAAANADLLGSFFEGITREGFKQTKGLFFTHGNVVHFLAGVLDIEGLVEARIKSDRLASEKLPYIIDPSCGSGTFLLASMTRITKFVTANRDALSVNDDTRNFINQQFLVGQENAWAGNFLYGVDATQTLAISTKVNMLLRQDGQAHIYNADGLAPLGSYKDSKLRGRRHEDSSVYSKEVASTFDVIMSNPPFSITLDPQTVRSLKSNFELAGDANSENLFLERWYQLLKPHGRLGAVLPESFFSTKENLGARLFLFAHFNVKAVVSLPKEAFEPWTPTRTSLLFAEKKSLAEERRWKNAAVKYETRAKRVLDIGLRAARALVRAGSALQDSKLQARWAEERGLLAAHGATVDAFPADATLSAFTASVVAWDAAIAALPPSPEGKTRAKIARAFSRQMHSYLNTIPAQCDDASRAMQMIGVDYAAMNCDTATLGVIAHWAQAASAAVAKVDVRVWAFQKMAPSFDLPLVCAAAENIGYRRTKRGETERPNDLFRAFENTLDGGPGPRVLDVDISTKVWTIHVDATHGADVLSQLRRQLSWVNE